MANQVEGGYLSPWLQRIRVNAARQHLVGRVLDVGCGNGYLARYFSESDYVGYDVDKDSIQSAKLSMPKHSFSTEPASSGKFDTIAMLAVIEHVKNPSKFINDYSVFLNRNGKIVITTPHPYFDWVHTLGAKIGIFSNHASEEHEKLLGKSEMKFIAENAGFNIKHAKNFLFGANQLFVLEKK